MNELKTVGEVAEVGAIVARFQSPILHEGHVDILNKVTSNHQRVVVFLGISYLKCTRLNPFDYVARKYMIEERYPNVEVYYIEDVGDNVLWSKNLDRQLSRLLGPNHKVVLYGSRDSFINAYTGKYPTVELVANRLISASEIRKQIGISSLATEDWRKGVVHALENQFPAFKPVVDAAIINYTEGTILLGKKEGETLWRFPGGFMDVTQDKCAEDAAIREAFEETQLKVTVEQYLCSGIIDDPRFRREQDKIMTFFFAMRYNGGTAVASDDLAVVEWKRLDLLEEKDINPDHRNIFKFLIDWYFNKIQKKI